MPPPPYTGRTKAPFDSLNREPVYPFPNLPTISRSFDRPTNALTSTYTICATRTFQGTAFFTTKPHQRVKMFLTGPRAKNRPFTSSKDARPPVTIPGASKRNSKHSVRRKRLQTKIQTGLHSSRLRLIVNTIQVSLHKSAKKVRIPYAKAYTKSASIRQRNSCLFGTQRRFFIDALRFII